MDTHEITRFLGESHYKKEITELSVQATGFQLVDLALNRNIAEVYQQILGYTAGDLTTLLGAYLQREDIWNIKTILRGKSYNAKPEEIMKAIRSAGKYPESYWQNIVQQSKTVQDRTEMVRSPSKLLHYRSKTVRSRTDQVCDCTNLMELRNNLIE